MDRLKDATISPNVLPFRLQIRVAANLWKTSDEFKELCAEYEAES